MKKLFICALVFLSSSSWAQEIQFSDWKFEKVTSMSGKTYCSIYSAAKNEGVVQNIAIKHFKENDYISITLYKKEWTKPQGANETVELKLSNDIPLQLSGYEDKNIVDMQLLTFDGLGFLAAIPKNKSLTIKFIDSPLEPSWILYNNNSMKELKKLFACMEENK